MFSTVQLLRYLLEFILDIINNSDFMLVVKDFNSFNEINKSFLAQLIILEE
jgi:hypothetical protein